MDLSENDVNDATELMGEVESELRQLLAQLSYAAGQYIECDERPRPQAVWSRFCVAQQDAAVYLNTGEMDIA